MLVVFASFLILYKLGQVPHGMTWDEAAIGYNGYAVITTRRDEWLQRLPMSFRSFGDYKAPLGIYINGLFTTLLGMKLWVVRLPFALAGIASVLGMVLLTEQLLRRYLKIDLARSWALAAGVLFLTEPWFLHFARVGFESGLALGFLIWGSWSLVWLLSRPTPSTWRSKKGAIHAGAILITAVWLVAAIYSYHAGKLVVPIIAGLLVCLCLGPGIFKRWREVAALLLISLIGLVPLLKDLFLGSGGERFNQVTLFSKGLLPGELLAALFTNTLAHLDPRFIIGGLTPTLRHGDGAWGILLPTAGVLLLTGLVLIGWCAVRKILGAKPPIDLSSGDVSLLVVGWLWGVVGFVPAILGVDVPHSNRALLALPGAILVIIIAARWWWAFLLRQPLDRKLKGSHNEKHLLLKSVVGTFVLLHGLFFLAYQHHYYTVFARTSATDFKDGYLDVFAYVVPYERGEGRPAVDKVIFTNDYGQPYIYAIFARRTSPLWYQGGSLIKYEFNPNIPLSDLERKNTVIVGSGLDQLPVEQADEVIYGSDGEVKFKIYVR